MEKDEKIRQVQSQRTRTLGIFSAAALAAIFVAVFLLGGPDNESINNLDSSTNTALRKTLSEMRTSRQHGVSHLEKREPTLTERRQAHLHHKEHNDKDAEQQHVETLGERRHRRHDHHVPEENVAVQQHDDVSQAENKNNIPKLVAPNQPPEESEHVLEARVSEYDKNVREIKKNVVAAGGVMETDAQGVAAAQALQEATRLLLKKRYGLREPYRVKVDLEFQPSNPTMETDGPTDSFTIELAPARLVPHSIFSFLEIARHWDEQKGAFHRRANHVLQVMVNGKHVPHLAFQEYSPEFPHVKGTVGYAGRPSGPAWYVSIQDNSRNHGPGSQQQRNPHEADSCFGKVVEGFERVVLGRITKMPGDGFLKPPLHVKITKMTILVPDDNSSGNFVPWKGSTLA